MVPNESFESGVLSTRVMFRSGGFESRLVELITATPTLAEGASPPPDASAARFGPSRLGARLIPGQVAGLELRHRQPARAEDTIGHAEASDLRKPPCFAHAVAGRPSPTRRRESNDVGHIRQFAEAGCQ
jgi:hypothetical protein